MMEFAKYSDSFRKSARLTKMPEQKVKELLAYAENLNNQGLPIIYDQLHLSLLVGYDYSYLVAVSNDASKFYKHYEIPKRRGGSRPIDEPLPSLKEIQRWILDNILVPASSFMVSPVAKAFMPGKSLRENARFHRGREKVVALDIHDFFPSIGFGAVFGVFEDMGYNKAVAVMLARLCTYHKCLPQGAPTSPMLSNMVFKRSDDYIFHYCRKRGIQYTRYADDLTFSGDNIYTNHLVSYVKMLLSPRHFVLNEEKTKVMTQGRRQNVTGVVVNVSLQVPRAYRDKVRQEVYYCIKYGVVGHMGRIEKPLWIETSRQYLRHLLGKVNYVLQINPKDKTFLGYRECLREMMAAQ